MGRKVSFSVPSWLLVATLAISSCLTAFITLQRTGNGSSSVAEYHSFGFFSDIPDDEWLHLFQKQTLSAVNYRNLSYPDDMAEKKAYWIFHNWDPYFHCPRLKKVGGLGDGPKWTCDPDRLRHVALERSDKSCLIYSIGSNGNFAFEDALSEWVGKGPYGRPLCEIHVFDPGDYQRDKTLMESKNMHFHQWGLTSDSRTAYRPAARRGEGEYISFQEIKRRLGHMGRKVDIFKIDCEGCEW